MTDSPKANVATTRAQEAIAEGRVAVDMFVVDGDLPSFRRGGYRRHSEIDDVLETVAEKFEVGQTVCIRQYQKKESASGTLYNIRKRHAEDNPQKWEFNLAPLDDLGIEGMTGLFVTRLA